MKCVVGAAQRTGLTSCIEADVTCQFLGAQGNLFQLWSNICDMLLYRAEVPPGLYN